jgi:hypothetical protein
VNVCTGMDNGVRTVGLVVVLHVQERVEVDVAEKLNIWPARREHGRRRPVYEKYVLYSPVVFVLLEEGMMEEELRGGQ